MSSFPPPHALAQVRYIIDFYNAVPAEGKSIALHLDVRPALDSPTAVLDRARMVWRWLFTAKSGGAFPQQSEASADVH